MRKDRGAFMYQVIVAPNFVVLTKFYNASWAHLEYAIQQSERVGDNSDNFLITSNWESPRFLQTNV